MSNLGHDLAMAMIDHIEQGRLDDDLSLVAHAIKMRQTATGSLPTTPLFGNSTVPKNGSPGDRIMPGDTIKITGRLRPNYLLGHTHKFITGDPVLVPQICVFNDAYGALRQSIEMGLLDALRRRKIRTRDDLSRILLDLGFRDVSDNKM